MTVLSTHSLIFIRKFWKIGSGRSVETAKYSKIKEGIRWGNPYFLEYLSKLSAKWSHLLIETWWVYSDSIHLKILATFHDFLNFFCEKKNIFCYYCILTYLGHFLTNFHFLNRIPNEGWYPLKSLVFGIFQQTQCQMVTFTHRNSVCMVRLISLVHSYFSWSFLQKKAIFCYFLPLYI